MSRFPTTNISMDFIRTAYNKTGEVNMNSFKGEKIWDENGTESTVPEAKVGFPLSLDYFRGKYYTNPITTKYYVVNQNPTLAYLADRYASGSNIVAGVGVSGDIGWGIWFKINQVGTSSTLNKITEIKYVITNTAADGRGGSSVSQSGNWYFKINNGIKYTGSDIDRAETKQTLLNLNQTSLLINKSDTGAAKSVTGNSNIYNVYMQCFLQNDLTITAINPTSNSIEITETQYNNNSYP